MRAFRLLGLGAAVALASSVLGVGCSSSSSSNGGGDSGAPPYDSGVGGDAGGGGMDTGVVNDTGTPPTDTGAGTCGDAGAPSAGCTNYCNIIMGACTGANVQYQSMTECLAACAFIPTGAATTGNTLACHTMHAMNAVTGPVPHCWHAGPYG